MNKLIIVGHPTSGYEAVEALLLRCGMKPALPSRREGLLPKDLHETLRKAHQLPALETVTEQRDFASPPIGTVWHGMAMDLLLGNLDREPWGWADPNTVFFLEYWCALDPESVFVLVYDDPESVLMGQNGTISEKVIERTLDNWASYNDTLLKFYFQHPDRCILIHSRELQRESGFCLEEIQNRLTAPLKNVEVGDLGEQKPQDLSKWQGESERGLTHSGLQLSTLAKNNHVTERFLARCQLEFRGEYMALYDELQATANLPHNRESDNRSMASEALGWWREEREYANGEIKRLEECLLERDIRYTRMVEDQKLTLLHHRQVAGELEQAVVKNQRLRKVSGELEQTRLENQELRHVLDGLRAEMDAPAPLQGAGERVKQQLAYRLGSLIVSDSKSPIGFVCLPLSLILESLRYRRERSKATGESLPPLHEYADAEEAERVKKHLSYRLGNTLVRRSRSPLGWFILPFALIRQTQAHYRSRRA